MIGAVRVLAATTTTTPATASNASNSDRGVIHQLFLDLGSTKSAAHTAQIYLDAPVKVVVILVVAVVVTRLVSRISRRMVNGMRLVSPLVQATPRGTARVKTLGGAFTSVFRAVIWVIALLEILNEFSINLAPFVATATVLGAALGFGAQTLVKDFLSGILILAEDQYGVGDHVAVGVGSSTTAGTVESVNLRVTRLRGADGGILYVPNGDIRILSNDTETDSQALVDVMVPFGTDLVAAGVAAQEAARELAADPEWTGEFVSEPYFAGVQDATNATGFVVRIMALTRPGQHLRMAREMRLRIIERLRRQGIAWAGPDARPPELPAEEIDRARAEKREAEEATAEKLDGPGVRRPARARAKEPGQRGSGKAAAARAAVAKRVSTRKQAEGTPSREPESGQPGSREHEDGGAPNP
jgi:small conductance mechanosensitive channel